MRIGLSQNARFCIFERSRLLAPLQENLVHALENSCSSRLAGGYFGMVMNAKAFLPGMSLHYISLHSTITNL